MSLTKQADALATLKGYLDHTYAPGVIGALGGATAAGLATGSRANENSRQRSLRVIRNALAGGLVGGAGVQLTAGVAGPMLAEAVGGKTDAKPGILSSFAARLGAMGAYHGASRIGTPGRIADGLQSYFKGMGDVHTGTPAVPPTVGPGGIPTPGPAGSPAGRGSLFQMDLPAGYTGKPRDYYKGLAQQIYAAAGDRANFPALVDKLINGMPGQGSAKGDPVEIKKWLLSNFSHDWKSRAIRNVFPRSSHFRTEAHRAGFRRGGVAGLGLSFFAPDIVRGVTNAFSDEAGAKAKNYMTFGLGAAKDAPDTRGLFHKGFDALTAGRDPFAGEPAKLEP